MNYLPAGRSGSWLVIMVVYGVALTLLLWLNRFIVLEQSFDGKFALRFALMAFIIAIVANGFAWLGARWLWLFITLGTIVGLALMFTYTARDMTGWEDLMGLLGFFIGVAAGFVIGLVAEGIRLVVETRRGSY